MLINFCLILLGMAVGGLLGSIIAAAMGLRNNRAKVWLPLDDEGQP